MRALTLHQPWAWAITDLGKRIENRTWAPPGVVLDQRIAIHAGKTYDQAGAAWLHQQLDVSVPADLPSGAIVATARVIGWIAQADDGRRIARYDADRRLFDDKWFTGPWGWVLDDVMVLPEPIAARGYLGCWSLQRYMVLRILAAYTANNPTQKRAFDGTQHVGLGWRE